MDSNVLSSQLLKQALAESRRKGEIARTAMADAQSALAAAEEEERILLRLVALRNGEFPTAAVASEAVQLGTEAAAERTPNGSPHPSVSAVVAILEEAKRPLHISELMRMLASRGVPIAGSGSQANLISGIRRDARLVRASRGMYGLATWGLAPMPIQQRKTRKRRRHRRPSKS